MSEYAELFAENKINISASLRYLSDQDLKDIVCLMIWAASVTVWFSLMV
jgi:hypothetical protein